MTTSGRIPASRWAQRGQALTEMLVVSLFVLIPLLFIIPTVAKLISLRQDAELSARYAAWERTVWFQSASRSDLDGYSGSIATRTDADIAGQIDARILSSDGQAISSEADANYSLDAFLQLDREIEGDLLPLIEDDGAGGAVTHYASQRAAETEPDGMTGAIDDVMALLDVVSRFSLNRKGVYTASVSVPVRDLGGIFELVDVDMSNLDISRSNTLFAEPWQAGGNSHARSLISGLMLADFLNNDVVKNLQDIAAFSGISDELTSRYLDIGHVDIDPMPSYRLSEYDE